MPCNFIQNIFDLNFHNNFLIFYLLDLDVVFVHLEERIQNGGGPACLRFYAQLTSEELSSLNSNFRLTETLYKQIFSLINAEYPESLSLEQLVDRNFVDYIMTLNGRIRGLFGLT